MRLCHAGIVTAMLLLSAGCGRKTRDVALPSGVVALPDANMLAGLPGQVYGSQETSQIHWQPWTKASLEKARDTERLVLAVIALPQQPALAAILNELSSDPETVALINETYVPILIDGDSVREIGLLTAELCAEIGSGLQLPLMVWMTPDACPVGWRPLPPPGNNSAVEVFAQAHEVVARTWFDDPGYVSKNSQRDQDNRRRRMLERISTREVSDTPGADAQRALRQLTTLYDPLSRTFDEAGGLFPNGVLDLLTMAVTMENLPEDLRTRSRKVLGMLLDDLMPSPMFDPLDGGVFNAKMSRSWALPAFNRDCVSQARVIVSLLNAYEATGDRRALDRALGVLRFAESRCGTAEGLFRMDTGAYGEVKKWLWWHEDVASILTDEELAVWMPASGMKMDGNLSPEVDPMSEYFRGSSIAFVKSAEEIAGSLGLDPNLVSGTLERAKRKLSVAREKRLGEAFVVGEANAVATFRMVSAYATLYRVTGDTAYRDLAAETLGKAKANFTKGLRLKSFAGDAADSLTAGRAFLYGVAIQAALDVHAVTLDRSWLVWAGDLSSTVAEDFAAEGNIRECPPSADLIKLPVMDAAMLFDESTVGLISMSVSRLEALGIPVAPSLKGKVGALPISALDSPIPHTDLIQAALVREFGMTYIFGENIADTMREALARSPLKGVNRREAKPSDPDGRSPKPGEVLRIARGGEASPVKSVSEIKVPHLP
jgi:uncharacterized protein YyaL (SSP411 family)